MKKLILFFLLTLVLGSVSAQSQFNPQAGMVFTTFLNTPDNFEASANLGLVAGADFRLGKRFYFQPGVFYMNTATAILPTGQDSFKITTTRNSLRIKALAGFNIINREQFKLRINTGPSFDYVLNIKEKLTNGVAFTPNDSRYNTNILNWQAGLGLDVSFITLEVGYSLGLSRVYKDDNVFLATTNDIKYGGLYFTLGFVLGSNKED